MATYKELLAQKAALEAQINEAMASAKGNAIAEAKQLIADSGLTEDDVFGGTKARKPSSAKGGTVAPKYRDPATGKTWTGRGKAPLWIAGKDKEQFAI